MCSLATSGVVGPLATSGVVEPGLYVFTCHQWCSGARTVCVHLPPVV